MQRTFAASRTKNDRHEGTSPGVAASGTAEETGDVAMEGLTSSIGAVAELEPRQRVQQMMQTKGDEQPIDGAEYESRSGIGSVGHDETADLLIEQPVEGRVDHRHDDACDDGGGGSDDRHEAATAKEG